MNAARYGPGDMRPRLMMALDALGRLGRGDLMPLSDRELLDFDRDDWGEARAQRLLVDQPDLYRNHLVIARSLQRWAAGLLVEASVRGVSQHGRVDCIGRAARRLRPTPQW